ncbi:MAG: tRNA dihydrouridine synthase [Thermoguttaceae bacterium]
MTPPPPLRLGSLCIEFPVIQAALSGYSDAPMRKMARRFGADFTLCEVMLDQFVVAVSKRKSRLYFADTDDHPCGAQIMGHDPEGFAKAAVRLVQEGFDLIDLNFACPVKKVLGRGRGGSLLKNPNIALEIVERVRDAILETIPLTIKMRKGFDDLPESRDNFYKILDGSVLRGICGITIHGRTVKQRYEGFADWDFVREVKEYLINTGHKHIAVIGSGDLFSAETCRRRLIESGVDGLALARGVIGNPWLFGDVWKILYDNHKKSSHNFPSLLEQRLVLDDHFALSVQHYGEKRAATTMRAFGVKYAMLHPDSQQVRAAFVRVKTAADWAAVLDTFYSFDPE